MNTTEQHRETPRHPLREAIWWPPFAWLTGWVAGSALLIYVFTALEQSANPPSCHGIGWGCTPDPGASAVLYLFFIAGPALVMGSLLTVVLGLFGRRTRPVRLAVTAGLPPLLLLAVFAAA